MKSPHYSPLFPAGAGQWLQMTGNAVNNARKGSQSNVIQSRPSIHESSAPANGDPCVECKLVINDQDGALMFDCRD